MMHTDEPARLVLQAARRHVWVDGPEGPARLRVLGGVGLVPGDRVVVGPDGAVSQRLPRTNVLERQTARERRELAANVDLLGVVTAAGPRVSGEAMIGRTMAAALAQDMVPLLVLNKADLDTEGHLGERAARYRRLGFEVWVVSARTGAGLEALRARLAGHVTALVGASGVGKSSLINALCPEADQRVGELGDAGYGKHTTTLGRAIPCGGALLVDLPGVRSFGLSDASALGAAFPEVAEAAEGCRFADCAHQSEPGCAVREAVAAGRLDPDRVEAYRSIRASVAAGEEGQRRRR